MGCRWCGLGDKMFSVARNQQNTIRVAITPIVFVPGIMGSRLKINGAPDWDPDSDLTMARWVGDPDKRAKRMDVSNPAVVDLDKTFMSQDKIDRGWGSVAAKFYGSMLEALDAGLGGKVQATPVYAFGYDWRQPNKLSGQAFEAFVDQVLQKEGADSVMVVTHSMGGLVVRHAIAGGTVRPKLAGVIHIGQPVLGAPTAYRRLVEGTTDDLDGDISLVLGDSKAVAKLFAVVPAAMELLPHDARRSAGRPAHRRWLANYHPDKPDKLFGFPDSATSGLFNNYENSPPRLMDPTIDEELDERLRSAAQKAQQVNKKLGVKFHELTAVIYGDDQETDTGAFVKLHEENGIDGATYDVARGRTLQGDGTVATFSAEAIFPGERHELSAGVDPEIQRQWVVRGLAHDMMCDSAELQKGVTEMIKAFLHPPRLARMRIGANGTGAWLTVLKALGAAPEREQKSAEMEIRVAKQLVMEGETVSLASNPDTERTPDIHTNNGDVDVKYSKGKKTTTIQNQVVHALSQVGPANGRVIVVRAEGASASPQEFLDAMEAAFVKFFGSGPRNNTTHRLIEERTLPPLWEALSSPTPP